MRVKCGDVYVDRGFKGLDRAWEIECGKQEIKAAAEYCAYRLAYAHAGLGIGALHDFWMHPFDKLANEAARRGDMISAWRLRLEAARCR